MTTRSHFGRSAGVICAGDGNDVVGGGDGDDLILGGPGDDLLAGGPGNDRLIGEEDPGGPVDNAADDVPPSVTIERPVDGEQLIFGSAAEALHSCADNVELASCLGSVEAGALLATSEPGPHEFTLSAVDQAGNTTVSTVVYRVDCPTGHGQRAMVSVRTGRC